MIVGVFPASLMGVCIMVLLGAPRTMPIMNLGTTVLGLVGIGFGAASLSRWIERRALGAALVLGGLFAASFLDAGLDGVFRWVRLGPLRLHVAMLLTPALLWAWTVLWERQKTPAVIVLFALVLGLHVMQPDAGQATALAAGMFVLAAIPDKRYVARCVLAGLSVFGVAGAWLRPDPLAGVDFVEYIVPRAWAYLPLLGIAAIGALALLPLTSAAFAYRSQKNQSTKRYGLVLAAYFGASMLVPFCGEFPMPLLGFGASPILGALLGLGLLAASEAQSGSGKIDSSALANAAML